MNPVLRICAIAAIGLQPLVAHSQSFPIKPLRIILPTTQGTLVDLFPRLLTPRLEKRCRWRPARSCNWRENELA